MGMFLLCFWLVGLFYVIAGVSTGGLIRRLSPKEKETWASFPRVGKVLVGMVIGACACVFFGFAALGWPYFVVRKLVKELRTDKVAQ